MVDSLNRPFTTVVLATSLDGKIADFQRSAARFGSPHDKAHLEKQIAQVDAVLFGAGTLRAYGTTLRITHSDLLNQRQQQSKPQQPVHIVCSPSANLDPDYPFFRQPVPRWLLTTTDGANRWQASESFEQILVAQDINGAIIWHQAFEQLYKLDLRRLAVLGGGTLISSLLEEDLIDEIWLTLCPLILGGATAPTLVDGPGFLAPHAPRLHLLESRSLDNELFLHYQIIREPQNHA